MQNPDLMKTPKHLRKDAVNINDQSLIRTNPHVPEEIWGEILSRFSVREVLQMQLVSRTWKNSTSSSNFVETQIARNPIFKIIYTADYQTNTMITLDPHLDEQQEGGVLDIPGANGILRVWIVGSCCGIVCLNLENQSVVFWNPTMRRSIIIPHPHLGENTFTASGFGYDDVQHTYKYVCFVWASDSDQPNLHVLCNGNWTIVENCPPRMPVDTNFVYAIGGLNWYTEEPWLITSFDMSTQRFREIPITIANDNDLVTLGSIHTNLVVLRDRTLTAVHNRHVEVWQFGMLDTWNRLFTIPYMGTLTAVPNYQPYKLIFYSNDTLWLRYGMSIIKFNTVNNTFTEVINDDLVREVGYFVESVASP